MARDHCIHCLEEIREGARRCPHCSSWQSRWLADPQSPRSQVLLLGIIVAGLALIILAVPAILQEGPDDRLQAGEALSVGESELIALQRDGENQVAVVGVLANISRQAWTNIFFQVLLFDANDRVIDTFAERSEGLVVPSRGVTHFRLIAPAAREPTTYHRHEVHVRWASPLPDFRPPGRE